MEEVIVRLTPERLQELRGWHFEKVWEGFASWCDYCEEPPWPCEQSKILDMALEACRMKSAVFNEEPWAALDITGSAEAERLRAELGERDERIRHLEGDMSRLLSALAVTEATNG